MSALDSAISAMPSAAQSAVDAIIDAGAREFCRDPWRLRRLVPNADLMGILELRRAVADRARVRRPVDMNMALALAQLTKALSMPEFDAAWQAERQQARTA